MTYLLVALLALSLGWVWGHSVARIRHIPVGAVAAQDEAAFDAACCETWLVSRGAEHDEQCVIARWAA
ncbi:hypothetical protein [Streptomyces sp. NPDC051684]|uniref:hypothetical protein n=1 Tax=Streptomyces sp. NPDC051684 TaxID=3365670 RepID=UPI00378E847A